MCSLHPKSKYNIVFIKAHFDAISGRERSIEAKMAMCNTTESYADALITAQNHGPVLAMVAWFLACLLVRACWLCWWPVLTDDDRHSVQQ